MSDTDFHIELPNAAEKALLILDERGYEAWCVGGFVRDELMGRPTHDVDIATNAHWRQTEEAFAQAGCATHETGIDFGTMTVIVDEMPIEITTYRADADYRDARHPSQVAFVSSLEEDLARRDFTMNALAYHPKRGLRDPFDGERDIRNALIRTVGEAHERFSEDALRILRAVRFSSQLGFSLEDGTYTAMLEGRQALTRIAVERIAGEMDRMLIGEAVETTLMTCIDVIGVIIPELLPLKGLDQRTPYHIYDALEHTAHVVGHAAPNRLNRWAALLHDIGKPSCFTVDAKGQGHFFGHPAVSADMARMIMGRLKMPPRLIDDVAQVIALHDANIAPTSKAVKRSLRALGGRVDLFRALIDLKIADALSQTAGISDHLDIARALSGTLDKVLASGEAFTIADLAINGKDLIEMDVPQGPAIGSYLNRALDAVIDGQVENEHGALSALVRAWLNDA